MQQHIIAIGGGGFSVANGPTPIDRYLLSLTGKAHPRVAMLPQASGESREYIIKFYEAYNRLECRCSHLSLFSPHTADVEGYLLEQDIIFVGGGNTKSMLALWREWGLDAILRQAGKNGIILTGISAGANCWFEDCTTDSIPGDLTALPCLGFLKGSCTPHYDGEEKRKPAVRQLVSSGELRPGHAFDDGAAGHFIDGELHTCLSWRPNAGGYYVDFADSEFTETPLPTRHLES
jgi:dipeptidase E